MGDKKSEKQDFPIINREISWLSFNSRVLQEAEDKTNPLVERLRFLGIFSNNLDEFYRVRVASVRRMESLDKKTLKEYHVDPTSLLKEISTTVAEQQKKFESIYNGLKEEFKEEGIIFLNEQELDDKQREEVSDYFAEEVRANIIPLMLDKKRELPNLKDKEIYLAIKLSNKKDSKVLYSLIKVPTSAVSRFYVFEQTGPNGETYVILLDDIIRANLSDIYSIFSFDNLEAYTIKFTRDAELDIDDDIASSLLEQISRSLENRKVAEPVRFVHDKEIPDDLLYFLTKKLGIVTSYNIKPGGRYHNFKDFMGFPALGGSKMTYTPLPPLKHPFVDTSKRLVPQIRERDIMLNYPYQSFDVIIDLLREAAIDPKVTKICINLYRVASTSKIINALVSAVRNGKKVQVIVELRARFDEQNNIYWSNVLQEAGAEIIFGVKGLKVHSKLILIERKRKSDYEYIAHVGTGNFHEGTARIYGDTALLTTDTRIALEVKKVFEFFENNYKVKRYSHLIISPNGSRRKFNQLINNEIRNAKRGERAEIILKLNNLVDEELIKKLYEASQAGVKIVLIIRGICSLVPGVKGWSENIEAISIVDRFLEHSRILYFYAGGDEKIFISSADWMVRNLDLRVEVTAPIYDEDLKKKLKKMLAIQIKSNVKTRLLDRELSNTYREVKGEPIRAQLETYEYFRTKYAKKNK
ncbi:polyphosphate kinase 1 [Parvicella tangerina]|uniref:Polyphosphate kinase n=1 Tax=Parvicella tangerina TaxID=2829795 RepID=A0A916JK86_9FLAO|nr:polyphosphate kinase 1 [Parvicella tangerina]CAG5078570.1 Polyphosphate kinase [Parvicella tangerina]